MDQILPLYKKRLNMFSLFKILFKILLNYIFFLFLPVLLCLSNSIIPINLSIAESEEIKTPPQEIGFHKKLNLMNIKYHDPFFANDTAFFDSENKERHLDEFEDQVILLVFWASWCGDCSDMIKSLDTLANDFKKLPLKIIAISEDYQGLKSVDDFYNLYNIRHLEKFYDHKNALFAAMNVVGIPTCFLITTENKVKLEFKGRVKWHDNSIREIILAEIPGNNPMPKNSYKEPDLNYKIHKKSPNIYKPLEDQNLEKQKTDEENIEEENNPTEPTQDKDDNETETINDSVNKTENKTETKPKKEIKTEPKKDDSSDKSLKKTTSK